MSDHDLITIEEAAELLGLPKSTLAIAQTRLRGFPVAISQRQHSKRLYSRTELLQWAAGKDVPAMARAIAAQIRRDSRRKVAAEQGRSLREQQAADKSAAIAKALELGRRFAAGEFATEEEKRRFAIRRMTARLTQPATIRITITPDWLDEHQPQKKRIRSVK